jgi:DNA polymerase I-like protein with 3'-5' exonuclease and polymerase domains
MEHKLTHIERIVNTETNEITEQPYTPEQLAEYAAEQAAKLVRAEKAATKATDKAALLTKLGITEDEARLLLG